MEFELTHITTLINRLSVPEATALREMGFVLAGG